LSFLETSQKALISLRDLLDIIDHKGQWNDNDIEKKYGKRILTAFLNADESWKDADYYTSLIDNLIDAGRKVKKE